MYGKPKPVKPTPPKAPVQIKKAVPQPQIQKTTAKTVQKPKAEAKAPVKVVPKAQPAKQVLSEKEETIVWNQWRANVENEIVKLLVSTKILNRSYASRIDYTFDVDTAQNISNINITVSPTRAQSEAEPKFRKIISMLNKSSALKFPKGTQRTKVMVKDSVHHEGSGEASNASDYSDYEKIR